MGLTPIQRFYNNNTNPITRKNYEFQFNRFLKWGKFTPDEFVNMERSERQDTVLQYIQSWKIKTEKHGTPAPSSYTPMIASIVSFCEANEIDMNWKIIKKSIPKITHLSNRDPYENKDIIKMLSVANNLRDIAFIHLMASTAPRIGEVNEIKIKDIIPIENGAILKMYSGQLVEYRVPMTPEAYSAIKNYLGKRVLKDESSPLFTTNGLSEKPLSKETVREFMKKYRDKVENIEKNGKRKSKAPNNAFRKRLQICYSMARIDPRFADYFLNHNLGKQDIHYFRRMSNEQIWESFKPAIPYITLDESLKTKSSAEKEIKIVKEEYEGAFKEKLEAQDEIIQNLVLDMASAKYMTYETRYAECFGGANPNLEKLAKLMSNEEIDDWNRIIPIVQRSKDWTIEPLNTSETRLKNIQELKETKKLIEKCKKSGWTNEQVSELEKIVDDIAREGNLDKNRY